MNVWYVHQHLFVDVQCMCQLRIMYPEVRKLKVCEHVNILCERIAQCGIRRPIIGDSTVNPGASWKLSGLGVIHNYRHLWKRTQRTLGEGVWDHRTLFPRKSTFSCNHWQWIIKYCTCLACGQYAHICRSFVYNNTFEALFLTSKCTKRGFL